MINLDADACLACVPDLASICGSVDSSTTDEGLARDDSPEGIR